MKYYSENKWLKDGSRRKEINEYANLIREASKIGGPDKLREEYKLRGANIVAEQLSHRMDRLQEALLDLTAQTKAKPYLKIVDKD